MLRLGSGHRPGSGHVAFAGKVQASSGRRGAVFAATTQVAGIPLARVEDLFDFVDAGRAAGIHAQVPFGRFRIGCFTGTMFVFGAGFVFAVIAQAKSDHMVPVQRRAERDRERQAHHVPRFVVGGSPGAGLGFSAGQFFGEAGFAVASVAGFAGYAGGGEFGAPVRTFGRRSRGGGNADAVGPVRAVGPVGAGLALGPSRTLRARGAGGSLRTGSLEALGDLLDFLLLRRVQAFRRGVCTAA